MPMIRFIALIIAFTWLPQAGHSQATVDTIPLARLREIGSINEIYNLPHSRYTLDHFVFVRKSVHIDPYVQYNKRAGITDASRSFLNSVQPGDTIIIKEVYAINSEVTGAGAVKLPERKFVVK